MHIRNHEVSECSIILGVAPEARVNVFNSHVNRMPVTREIVDIVYRPGKFFNTSRYKESVDNERNSMRIRFTEGRDLAIVQIAGLTAQRIVCFVRKGDAKI